MPQATVTSSKLGLVAVRVRRNPRQELLQGRHTDLFVGDRIEVKRIVNNPYLVFVHKVNRSLNLGQ